MKRCTLNFKAFARATEQNPKSLSLMMPHGLYELKNLAWKRGYPRPDIRPNLICNVGSSNNGQKRFLLKNIWQINNTHSPCIVRFCASHASTEAAPDSLSANSRNSKARSCNKPLQTWVTKPPLARYSMLWSLLLVLRTSKNAERLACQLSRKKMAAYAWTRLKLRTDGYGFSNTWKVAKGCHKKSIDIIGFKDLHNFCKRRTLTCKSKICQLCANWKWHSAEYK